MILDEHVFQQNQTRGKIKLWCPLDSTSGTINKHGGATTTAEGEDIAMLDVNQAMITDTITTVQCDTCGKWRHTPYGNDQIPEGAWYCSMNSWDVYNSCDAPEQ